jgi:hypothetical protein
MRTRSAPRRAALPVAAAVLLLVAPAAADDAADTATARGLGVEGMTLANGGRCKEAVEKLTRAEKLHHAPTTATRLGECEIELGGIVRGTERLQRVIREPLADGAHPAFTAAVARAAAVLERTLPRIARLRIAVDAPAGTKLTMTVDDEPTSDAVVGTDRATDPGTHVVKVSAEGFLTTTLSTSLGEGQTKSVRAVLRPDPSWRPARASDATPRGAQAGEARGSKVPAIVAFGLGAVGLGLGIYGAIVVDQKTAALSSGCDANKVCPAGLQGDLRDAKTWASVSTAGFITAGAGAATGLVLLLVSGSTWQAPKTGLRVRPSVGVTSAGIDGVF